MTYILQVYIICNYLERQHKPKHIVKSLQILNILDIMATYKGWICLSWLLLMFYINIKWEFYFVCLYPLKPGYNSMFALPHSTFSVSYCFYGVVSHLAFAAVYISVSLFQLHVNVQHSSGALLVRIKVKWRWKKKIQALDSTKCILIFFFLCVKVFRDLVLELIWSCFLFRCYD